jgi:hypothetical protein
VKLPERHGQGFLSAWRLLLIHRHYGHELSPTILFDVLPPVGEAENISFEERIKYGFDLALDKGLDLCIAMSSVTVAIGDRFGRKGKSKIGVKALIKKPKKSFRLLKGIVKSKLAGRPMLPRDIWKLKGLVSFGIDGSVYPAGKNQRNVGPDIR